MKNYQHYFYIIVSFLLISVLRCGYEKDNSNSKTLQHSQLQNFKGFYFISNTNNYCDLLYYDFLEDSVIKVFRTNNQKIIQVEHNTQNNTTFFITVSRLNKKIAIPEYERIKLYRYDPVFGKIELINRFSSSIQIYSFWLDINRFKFIRVYFDEVVASYVNKHSLIYNPFGKLLSEENEVFDLVKSGYPVKETPYLRLISLNKKYQIKIETDSIFVLDYFLNKSNKVISAASIIDLIWADNEKHLIIFYEIPISKKKNILLFDLINNKIAKTFNEEGIKNVVVLGNYLIYDFQEGNQQKIEVVNIEKLLTVKKISIGKNSYLKNVSL